MANSDNCPSPRAGPQTRPAWKAGSYLTASACSLEQNYRLQKFRRHNREMHGWGVVCGLWVVPAADGSHPWAVQICPGYAVGPYGDEIELPQAVPVDVAEYTWFRPEIVGIGVFQPPAYIVVQYQDWTDDLTLVPNAPCSCNDPVYVDGRIVGGYLAGVIWTAPEAPSQFETIGGLCLPESLPCPPCPSSPWVTLARIDLPAPGVPITAAMIDNGIRTTL
jgi:hypothetical protein